MMSVKATQTFPTRCLAGLCTREPDNFRPLVGFFGNELFELGGSEGKHRAAEFGDFPIAGG